MNAISPALSDGILRNSADRLSPAARQLHEAARENAWVGVMAQAFDIGTARERADESFLVAVALYRERQWQRAYAHLALLADGGHSPAAKLALLMLRHGSALYGDGFHAGPAQVARWARHVIGRTSGSSHAGLMD